MRFGRGLGVLGVGIASGAVLAVPAAAHAAPATSNDYKSTATATPGYVAVGGTAVTNSSSATATDSSSPRGSSTGTPSGTSLPAGLGSIVPQADLVSTKADASRSGTSDACSAVASGGCGAGTAQPLTVQLSLSGILDKLGLNLPIGTLPVGGLGGYSVDLSLTGPAAACTAGPADGSGHFTASQTPASGTVEIKNGNSTVIGPQQINGGDVLSGLTGGVLGPVLALIPQNAVTLSYTPGSSSGAGPESKAAAGKLALGVAGTSALAVVGGAVSCGANQAAPGQTVSSSSPATPPASSTIPGPGLGGLPSTSGEKPLSKIQSDEGRYVPVSDDTPLWGSLAAGGAALAAGLALWRRRRLNHG